MKKVINIWQNWLSKPVSIAPLALFRVVFGFMMTISTIRFMVNGWIVDQFITPKVFFSYYGFEWVKYPGDIGIYILFGLVLISSLLVMIGLFYRMSIVTFFCSFTYIELIDKTNYLNHYYFVSLVAFIMILLPAHRYFSVDSFRKPYLASMNAPNWTIIIIKFQLAIVYIYAGIAKLNYDWLVEAMPLKLWLPANAHLPIIGSLLQQEWVAYTFSWFGAAYDLFIVGFLIFKPTRIYAYGAVILFHLITWLLFPIGMFPWIMILSTLIFFDSEFHEKIIGKIQSVFRVRKKASMENTVQYTRWTTLVLSVYIVFQLLLPWRYLMYPGDLFWTEEGYRFSWRVMLMEKAGYTTFHILEKESGKMTKVSNEDYLTIQQEKMMATQPDMILQFAKHLAHEYKNKGVNDLEVHAESYVTLNGKRSKLFIDPNIDLSSQEESFKHKSWILEN